MKRSRHTCLPCADALRRCCLPCRFFCEPTLLRGYIAADVLTCGACMVFSLADKFQTKEYRFVRMSSFLAAGAVTRRQHCCCLSRPRPVLTPSPHAHARHAPTLPCRPLRHHPIHARAAGVARAECGGAVQSHHHGPVVSGHTMHMHPALRTVTRSPPRLCATNHFTHMQIRAGRAAIRLSRARAFLPRPLWCVHAARTAASTLPWEMHDLAPLFSRTGLACADFVGASHQIFHMMVLMACIVHYFSVIGMYRWRAVRTGCGLPAAAAVDVPVLA